MSDCIVDDFGHIILKKHIELAKIWKEPSQKKQTCSRVINDELRDRMLDYIAVINWDVNVMLFEET